MFTSFAPHLHQPFLTYYKTKFHQFEDNRLSEEKLLKQTLKEIQKKIDVLEEGYYITKVVPAETYQKFSTKFGEEKNQVLKNLELTTNNTSNYVETLSKTLQFSLKLPVIWSSGNVAQKEKLQKLIFPDGITYDRKNGAFRTPKVNEVFSCIADLNSVSTENKKGQTNDKIDLSLLAEREGLTPISTIHYL